MHLCTLRDKLSKDTVKSLFFTAILVNETKNKYVYNNI